MTTKPGDKLEQVQAYVGREMSDAEADAFEDAMFATPEDPDVIFVDRVSRHGARLIKHGTFDMGTTRAHLEKLKAEGHTIAVLDAGEPCTKTFTIPPEGDLVMTKFVLGRTDLQRVDVEIEIPAYGATKTIRDCLVDSDGCVYGLCERPLAELAFGTQTLTRVRALDAKRTVLGEWNLTSVRG